MTVVVERCRVRVINRCPWVDLDREMTGRATTRLVADHVHSGLFDRQARNAVGLAGATVRVHLRCGADDLAALAAGTMPVLVAHRLIAALDQAVAGLAPEVELVDQAEHDDDRDPAELAAEAGDRAGAGRSGLWVGPLAVSSGGRWLWARRQPPPAVPGPLHHLGHPGRHDQPVGPAGPVGPAPAGAGPWPVVAHAPQADTDTCTGPTSAPGRRIGAPAGTGAASRSGSPVGSGPGLDEHPVTGSGDRPAEASQPSAVGDRAAAEWPTHPRSGAAPGPGPGPDGVAVGVRGEARVRSVLPYLVLVSLHQHGLLDELVDGLIGSGMEDLMADLVAALAGKVLGRPEPGSDDRSDEVVAGLIGPIDGSHLELLAARADRWLRPVTVSAAELLFVDRPGGATLVAWVNPATGAVTLADDDGLFPLVWDGDEATAEWWWRRAGAPAVIGHWPLAADPEPPHVDRADRLGAAWARLRRQRAVAWADRPDLESGLAALAAFGLADVAHRVFSPLGPTDPEQALVHFADLDAGVELLPDRVVVTMAVGRRHADLRDAGLLETIPEAAWLGGRDLELLGG